MQRSRLLAHRRPRPWATLLVLCLTSRASAQTTGLQALTDLGTGSYAGFQGGLYPGGLNMPPPAHLATAFSVAAQVVPRNAAGAPDPDGWIGMIAVGMSNTTHEFGAFERNADRDTSRNARVVLMDTGFGGMSASVISNPAAPYWTTMMQRVAAMGLTPAQVQVAWLKEAESGPPNNFPLHAMALRDTLARIARNLHDKFPNLRLCYVSSRIYGGYAQQGGTNPEPQAFESGFSVKWLIEKQLNGDADVNADAGAGPVVAPVLLWGPYLWANGPTPRADGLTWPLGDLESDRVHPSPSGEQKVARLLAAFFATDTTAAAWWRAQPGTSLRVLDATDDATVAFATPTTTLGLDTLLTSSGGSSPQNMFARFDGSAVSQRVLLAKYSMRVFSSGGGSVRLVNDVAWNENTITWNTAPALGASLVTMPQASRDGTFGAQVTSAWLADTDHRMSFVATLPSVGPATYHSREGNDPPRLVLVVSTPVLGVEPQTSATRMALRIAPNPARRLARLGFTLPAPSAARVSVHAIDGRLVRMLHDGALAAGPHTLAWDGRDDRGRESSAGVYLVRLHTRAGDAVSRVAWLH